MRFLHMVALLVVLCLLAYAGIFCYSNFYLVKARRQAFIETLAPGPPLTAEQQAERTLIFECVTLWTNTQEDAALALLLEGVRPEPDTVEILPCLEMNAVEFETAWNRPIFGEDDALAIKNYAAAQSAHHLMVAASARIEEASAVGDLDSVRARTKQVKLLADVLHAPNSNLALQQRGEALLKRIGFDSSFRPIFAEALDTDILLDDALQRAMANDKRVLLLYGADWSGWSFKFNETLVHDAGVAELVAEKYELVLVSVDHDPHIAARFNTRILGLPFLTVLDAEGNKLVDAETKAFRKKRAYMPVRVRQFLEQWGGSG